jgi:uncharacterized GH25 family protein
MKKLLLISALSLCSSNVLAHTQWLKPSAFNLPKSDKAQFVDVDLSLGEQPFEIERALKPNTVTLTMPDGTALPVGVNALHTLKSNVLLELKDEGTHKLAAEFGPTVRKPKPGATNARPAVKMHSRLVSFVSVGVPTQIKSVSEQYLDVKPLTYPADIVADEAFSLQFFNDGKPAANIDVSVVAEGNGYHNVPQVLNFKADDKGVVTMTIDKAGRYWLKASQTTDLTDDPEAAQLRASLGVALEVQVN